LTKICKFRKEGQNITLYVDDVLISRQIKQRRDFYEHWLLNAIKNLGISGGVWLDIGANFGNHSVFFEKFLNAEVHAFEPVPHNLELLRKNKAVNRCNFTIHPVAVSDIAGTGSFEFGGVGRWSQCKVVPGSDFDIVAIDDFDFNAVRAMKIDVEGLEMEVVLGSIETIERCLPELFIEAWEFNQLEEIMGLLPVEYKIIERYNDAPTYHLSVGDYVVTYKHG